MMKPVIEPLRKAKRQAFSSSQDGSRLRSPFGTLSSSLFSLLSMLSRISAMAKMPMATVMNSMPPSSSLRPKMKRDCAVKRSVPTVASHRPNTSDSTDLIIDLPDSSTTSDRPITISAKYSGEEKLSAKFAIGGATKVISSRPTVPATKEAMAAMPSAAPARPLRAIW